MSNRDRILGLARQCQALSEWARHLTALYAENPTEAVARAFRRGPTPVGFDAMAQDLDYIAAALEIECREALAAAPAAGAYR